MTTDETMTDAAPVETHVSIPGEVTAHYRADGTIDSIVFMPHGSNAGWFGPVAVVDEGDETLDVEDTDGPFWRAVQTFLADGGSIGWEE